MASSVKTMSDLMSDLVSNIMSSLTNDLLVEVMNRPIAARLPAEPGWKVILQRPKLVTGLPEGIVLAEGESLFELTVLSFTMWAVEAPLLNPARHYPFPSEMSESADIRRTLRTAMESWPYQLWPLDAEGRRFHPRNLVDISGPQETAEEALERNIKWTKVESEAARQKDAKVAK